MKIKMYDSEYWYGGIVHQGTCLPIGCEDDRRICLRGGVGAYDQYSPLFLSSRGRILHADHAFDVHFNRGEIELDDDTVELSEGFETLRGAYLEAARRYFPLQGKMPDERFFRSPQYNTWIELMYNQNQDDILAYAHSIINGEMKPGILMIDEGWAPDYGVYDFDTSKFSDAHEMVNELHALGFSVMLWVTPMISPDGNCFRSLRNTDLLLHDRNGKIAIREWWNGYSCVLDFSNPKACEWFREKLSHLMNRYGVDGFKFDSGDTFLYRDDDRAYHVQDANAHTRAFNRFCQEYTLNELRNVWDCGGFPLVCRLQDKNPSWNQEGLGALLPNLLTQGILGYCFGCPDMIGGGQYGAFLDQNYRADEELYLRWLAASLLCPMLQFSISPRRILSSKGFEALEKLLRLRERYTPTILSLAKNAAVTGEPILRYMEYEFPDCGMEQVKDQFLLGKDLLVAPILERGKTERTVLLPPGTWKAWNGQVLQGGCTVTLSAKLDELILLQKSQ